ncbi:hypothetical protein DM872_22255 [Pseudomonas taiwanensis]|uniref:hypothetical protein n=1 Tax=Pseudomonas taiwanensis TaxID=470150 RepID=UPI0015B94923|nr:hypothetical protein [Pseudomonas taiwanensis]NWL79576.1 hypothetical protein [Pseudomonas taiwanensis]
MTLAADDSSPDVHCDVCGCATRVPGYGQQFGTLQAHWGYGAAHDGGRYKVHLCERCFFLALATLRQEHRIQHMFDEEGPGLADDHEFGLVARDDFWGER